MNNHEVDTAYALTLCTRTILLHSTNHMPIIDDQILTATRITPAKKINRCKTL